MMNNFALLKRELGFLFCNAQKWILESIQICTIWFSMFFFSIFVYESCYIWKHIGIHSSACFSIYLSMVINLNVSRFIFRYEVRFQKALECGGAYIKLLADLPGLSLVWLKCHCNMFVLVWVWYGFNVIVICLSCSQLQCFWNMRWSEMVDS